MIAAVLLPLLLLTQADPLTGSLGTLAERGLLGLVACIGFGLFLRSEWKRDEERKASTELNTKLTDALRDLAMKSTEAITRFDGTVRDLAQRVTQ